MYVSDEEAQNWAVKVITARGINPRTHLIQAIKAVRDMAPFLALKTAKDIVLDVSDRFPDPDDDAHGQALRAQRSARQTEDQLRILRDLFPDDKDLGRLYVDATETALGLHNWEAGREW